MARAAAAVAWAAAILLTAAAAAAAPAGQAGSRYLLDVPYLPQSEDLCGGAAVAMVLRYWGDHQVHPEEFSPLGRPRRGRYSYRRADDGRQRARMEYPSAHHHDWRDRRVDARPGRPGKGGTLRVDVARGMRDQRTTLSTGWQAP